MDEDKPIDAVVDDLLVVPDHENHEIPASYLENPPPESLSSLDEQLTKV